MANTLTNLIPVLYKAADQVMREQVGFIPSVFLDADAEKVALNQTITYPIVGTYAAADIAPAATGPDPSDSAVGNGTMSISKNRSVTFYWTGDDQRSIRPIYDQILQAQFAQAMRALVNEIETDLFVAAKEGASRAAGTAGTTPFGTAANLADFADPLKILLDNGAPTSDLHMVLNTTAGAKLRTVQSSLFKVNEAGNDSLLRNGTLGKVEGFNLHESNQIVSHTKGTGTLYVTSGSTAPGVTDIALVTGTNTVVKGDVVTFAADSVNKYVVGTGVAAAGTISLNKPGARVTIATANAMTIGNNYTGNFAFDRNAIHLLTRVPTMPDGGDAADEVIEITDALSNITFQVALYRQRRRIAYEVGVAWGVKAVNSQSIVTLMG
jgi:hypothetical protein